MTQAKPIMYEYLLVIPPSSGINQSATKLKLQCKTDYGWTKPAGSKPHFTVCKFIHSVFNEAKVLSALRTVASETKPFNITLDNFGHYLNKDSYTIFIDVLNKHDYEPLLLATKKTFKALLATPVGNPVIYTNEPHLTIAKNISSDEFKKTWPDWANSTYNDESRATCLTLLRRPLRDAYIAYTTVANFKFLGMGARETQLALF